MSKRHGKHKVFLWGSILKDQEIGGRIKLREMLKQLGCEDR
jgi:hypothetical protein